MNALTNQITLTEYQECLLLVEYLEILRTQGKVYRYTHIPNETFTKSWGTKMKNKRMGVNPGFPDYIIIGKNKVICIEMKRAVRIAKASSDQLLWITELTARGIPSYVCNGFKAAKRVLTEEL